MRCHFGRLRDDGGIDIHHAIACFRQQPVYLAHQLATVDPLVTWIGIGKMPANITQRSCTQQRIAQGMQQYIRVRMAKQSFFIRNGNAADNKIAPGGQLVNIKPLPNSDFFHGNWIICFEMRGLSGDG